MGGTAVPILCEPIDLRSREDGSSSWQQEDLEAGLGELLQLQKHEHLLVKETRGALFMDTQRPLQIL